MIFRRSKIIQQALKNRNNQSVSIVLFLFSHTGLFTAFRIYNGHIL